MYHMAPICNPYENQFCQAGTSRYIDMHQELASDINHMLQG